MPGALILPPSELPRAGQSLSPDARGCGSHPPPGPHLLARASPHAGRSLAHHPFGILPDTASPADSRSLCPGRSYDEKVDVFSFGIVLCEVGPGWAAAVAGPSVPLHTPHSQAAGLGATRASGQGGLWEQGCPQQGLAWPQGERADGLEPGPV